MTTYRLDHDAFVIDGYADARPFASFLPGISGLWGIPMWAFYVNRGQAIASFGVRDKDHPLMEFLPANRAYRATPLQGFRTFIKIRGRGAETFYEPFQPSPRTTQRMEIRMHELVIEQRDPKVGLDVRVRYFTIPSEPFAALARLVTLTNRSKQRLDLELLDGLPSIVPFGIVDRLLKDMSRTIEAWVTVGNLEHHAPFFRLKVEPHDRPEVVPIHAGNFYVSVVDQPDGLERLSPIVDPSLVFGLREDFRAPERFLDRAFRVPPRQNAADKTPCAMSYTRLRLQPGEPRTIYSLFGHADSQEQLNAIVATAATPAFFEAKANANRTLIEDLTRPVETHSRLPRFDLYCRQTFLDNVLRGGTPITLGDSSGQPPERRKIFYVYGRKHGDLERDYNQFVLPATYFSQGNANYRDVNQNRRSDVWFHPEVEDHNVITFFNLIQADGYNPLIVKGTRYILPKDAQSLPELQPVLSKPFTPGELLQHIQRRKVAVNESPEALLNRIMAKAREIEDAEHGEGFWTDHWTYNLDLLQSYLAIYPDRLRDILIEKRVLTFYDNAHVVLPRAKKYQLVRGKVRQYGAVQKDIEKAELIRARGEAPHCMRTGHGQGPIYTTTLLVKMLCVVTNKLASLDPSGMGVEMESEKPNWYDALNGLPGLLGSSLCETFELKRWMRFLEDAIARLALPTTSSVSLPEELHRFLLEVRQALPAKPADYWATSANAKERYRDEVRLGFSGREQSITVGDVLDYLRTGIAKVDRGIASTADAKRGLYPSYFYHDVTDYTRTDDSPSAIVPMAWARRTLPLFLEGMMHALRLEHDATRARKLHAAVRRSPLYDAKLRMYRVCASLAQASEEIGRCRVFSPGWLENESIWVHMEYKYLLELMRCGLYEEFYADFFAALIPFQPPKRYGRSILENSSFLVSSAYADPSLHGAGFVARLSGATAEMLQMWLWMTIGREPFRLSAQGALELRPAPVLAAELFDAKGRFVCRLFGRTVLTYVNPSRRPTFGPRKVVPRTIRVVTDSNERAEFRHGVLPEPYAAMARRGELTEITVKLGA